MSGPDGQLTPRPGALSQPGGTPSSLGTPQTPTARNPPNLIPLMPGVARPTGARRELLREAVIQVVGHLVIKSVPPERRSPLFDQAAELLDEAGWGLDELYAAASDGPQQSALFQALGLET